MKRPLPRRMPLMGITAALMMLFASSAFAQPYGPPPPGGGGGYGQQPPPGYGPPAPPQRTIGFGVTGGLGFMQNQYEDLSCDGCDFNPVAFGGSGWGGFFLAPNLMLLGEIDGTARTLDAAGYSYLVQYTLTLGARLNINPALWVKGGIGWAGLDIAYNDGGPNEGLASGGALTLGVGYEFLRAPNYGVDVSFKFTGAGYDALNDSIYSGLFNLGFSWYL